MPDQSGKPLPGEPNYVPPGQSQGLLNSAPGTPNAPQSQAAQTTSGAPSASLISQATTAPTITPVTAPTVGYTAAPVNVAPEQTVAEQVKRLVDNDSPLMQQARARAMDTVNSRGLLNSSTAVSAGQQAVIASALPIATADAATHASAARSAEAAKNTAAQFGAQQENTSTLQTTLQNADSQTKALLAAVNNAATLAGTTMNTENQMAIANLDSQTKLSLGNLQAQNQQLLQTNTNAANAFSKVVENIASIARDPNLDATAKANATQSQMNLLNEQLRATTKVSTTAQADLASLNLGQFFAGGGLLNNNAPPPATPAVTPTAGQVAPGAQDPTSGLWVGANGQLFATQQQAQNSLAVPQWA